MPPWTRKGRDPVVGETPRQFAGAPRNKRCLKFGTKLVKLLSPFFGPAWPFFGLGLKMCDGPEKERVDVSDCGDQANSWRVAEPEKVAPCARPAPFAWGI